MGNREIFSTETAVQQLEERVDSKLKMNTKRTFFQHVFHQ